MGPITTCFFFNLLTASKKLTESVLDFGQNVSWKLLEIMPADLLDTQVKSSLQMFEGHALTMENWSVQWKLKVVQRMKFPEYPGIFAAILPMLRLPCQAYIMSVPSVHHKYNRFMALCPGLPG